MATLLVLLKHPRAGRVKTRLAAEMGMEQAANLYREWIGIVFDELQPLRGRIRIAAYFEGAPLTQFAAWKELADIWWPQPGGDLGQRLAAGFQKAHRDDGPVAAIGTDCLEINAPLIVDAFSRMSIHDVVFGPTYDGGYYLVGSARHLPGFFDAVPWSTRQTLSAHLRLCERAGWTVSTLPPRRDIDTPEDWLAYCGKDGSL
jgi:rSAM/selenodomain-associated transferase 1